MVYLLGKTFNEIVEKVPYIGKVLTKEVPTKPVLSVAGGLLLAGCALAPLNAEKPAEQNQPAAEAPAEPTEAPVETPAEAPTTETPAKAPAEEAPKETAEVEVKEPPRFYLGEIFDSNKPNRIGLQGSQTYDQNRDLIDINREIVADLWQGIGDGLDLRLWAYDNHADCFRFLKSQGETAVHTFDMGAGIYKQLTDELKVGVIAEYLRQKFENSGTENQANLSGGLSAILDSFPFKLEIGALLGQGDGKFKDGSKFRDKNYFQAGAEGSCVISEDLGTVLSAIMQYGSSRQEQLGTDWHYSPEGRAMGIQLTQTLFDNEGKGLIGGGKGKGIDLAVYGGISVGNYNIGPHHDLDPQRASVGILFRMTPDDIKGATIDGFLGVYQQNNYMNDRVVGIPRIENGFEAGIVIYFERLKNTNKERGNEK